jgi:hypothetical protein
VPYIVTTLSPCSPPDAGHKVSRRAVATLDEARGACFEILGKLSIKDAASAYHSPIGPQGGMVGPLPDETVIKVEAVEWLDLSRGAGEPDFGVPDLGHDVDRAFVLAAYNAHQRAS